jgi:hypothetical protein
MAPLKRLKKGLEELMPMVDVPEGKMLTLEEVNALNAKADQLAKIVTGRAAE